MSGGYSQVKVARGALIEYSKATDKLKLEFEFNPATITRSRTIEFKTGEGQHDSGGYDFDSKKTVPKAAQGVTVKPETFTVKILLDATDRMGASASNKQPDPGVQPELDVLRSMVEPKLQAGKGSSTLAALGHSSGSTSSKKPYASVLVFIWGEQTLPVFMTQVQIEVKAYLPSLVPYRAEATLTLQIIESNNPFYNNEMKRQYDSAVKESKTVSRNYKTPKA